MTKQAPKGSITSSPEAGAGAPVSKDELLASGLGGPLPGGLWPAAVGNVGVAIFKGQSPEDVLLIASVIERELHDYEVGHYIAREVARQILLALKGKEAKFD